MATELTVKDICPSLNDSDMTDCPLGISRFADAKDVIKACDIAFDELQVERLIRRSENISMKEKQYS